MIRPEGYWDKWFLGLAQYVSTASKDPSTKTGAVIVRSDRTVVSTGFNGFPRRMPDVDELYAKREDKYSRIVHCEVNAVLFAREPLAGCTLYTYPFAPCDRCVVQMIQAGITRFVFPIPSADALLRWGNALQLTKQYIQECGLDATEVKL